MKLLSIFLGCILAAFTLQADVPILILQVTNAAGTTNGNTLTVNGSARNATNDNSGLASTHFRSTNNTAQAATNLYIHLAAYAPANIGSVRMTNETSIELRGKDGTTLSYSIGGTWGAGILSTSVVAQSGAILMFPPGRYDLTTRSNYADAIIEFLRYTLTNKISSTNATWLEFCNLYSSQTLSNKTLASPILTDPKFTNAVNYGQAFSSPGYGTDSEQFGAGAAAITNGATAVGRNAMAAGVDSSVFGNSAGALGESSTAIGMSALATGAGGLALGAYASANFPNSAGIGAFAEADGTNVIMFGNETNLIKIRGVISGAILTNLNGIAGLLTLLTNGVLSNVTVYAVGGTASNWVVISGATTNSVGYFTNLIADVLSARSGTASNMALVNCTATNLNLGGSNRVSGDWAWSVGAATLAAGNNRLDPASYQEIELTAPGDFAVAAITNGYGGRPLRLWNRSSFVMTLAHESGWSGYAPERILVPVGTNQSIPSGGSVALRYSATAARWLMGESSAQITVNTNIVDYDAATNALWSNIMTLAAQSGLFPPTNVIDFGMCDFLSGTDPAGYGSSGTITRDLGSTTRPGQFIQSIGAASLVESTNISILPSLTGLKTRLDFGHKITNPFPIDATNIWFYYFGLHSGIMNATNATNMIMVGWCNTNATPYFSLITYDQSTGLGQTNLTSVVATNNVWYDWRIYIDGTTSSNVVLSLGGVPKATNTANIPLLGTNMHAAFHMSRITAASTVTPTNLMDYAHLWAEIPGGRQ